MLALAALSLGCRDTVNGRPASQKRPLLIQEEAAAILSDLPEVIQWAENVRSRSRGKVTPVWTIEHGLDDARREGHGRLTWGFCLMESDKQRMVTWNRFEVDAVSGEVLVIDPLNGGRLTLAEWRIRRGG